MTRCPEVLERHLGLARTLLSEAGRDVDRFPLAYSVDYGQQNQIMIGHYLTDNSLPHDVLSSNAAEAMDQIAGYERLGFTHLFLRLSAHGYSEFEEQASGFADEVMRPLNAGAASV